VTRGTRLVERPVARHISTGVAALTLSRAYSANFVEVRLMLLFGHPRHGSLDDLRHEGGDFRGAKAVEVWSRS
jgi:hypothetical protein